jgi:hypothetical protein
VEEMFIKHEASHKAKERRKREERTRALIRGKAPERVKEINKPIKGNGTHQQQIESSK